MTQNQIAYWNLQELKRSNLAKEGELHRSNLAKEGETHRANVTHEQETHRSNVARETETARHNQADETLQLYGVQTKGASLGLSFMGGTVREKAQELGKQLSNRLQNLFD